MPERHRLATMLAVDGVVAVALGLDLHNQAFAIPAPDDEVGRVAMPLAVLILVFYKEIRLARVGDRAGEINIFHLVRVQADVFQQLLEETFFRV